MSELYHHGILGQKWGVRRYQNYDGTLKSAGKDRYGEDSGYKDFYDRTNYINQLYKNTETRTGEKLSLRNNDKVSDFYTNSAKAVESYFNKNNISYGPSKQIYAKDFQWKQAPIYAKSGMGHMMSDGPNYPVSEIPNMYNKCYLDDSRYEDDEYTAILQSDQLITDEMIEEIEKLALDILYDYQKELELSNKSLISHLEKKEGLSGTEFSYKQAYINGNNAIALQRTANAMKAVQKAQRSSIETMTRVVAKYSAEKIGDAYRSARKDIESLIERIIK